MHHRRSDSIGLEGLRWSVLPLVADLVFLDRALTTLHANLAHWLEALNQLQDLLTETLVPDSGTATVGSIAME